MNLKRYIGDRSFYRRMLAVMTPILIQNVITNFVNLLDNIMVGQIGTEPMSGVAIVNQLLFVFNLAVFGAHAGAGIFTAQFFGRGDQEGVRQCFRIKLWLGAICTALFAAILLGWGGALIGLFLHAGEEALDLTATLAHGQSYLNVMLLELPLFALSQVYSSTLRECGETVLPMKAGIAAVLVNLLGNWVLIYGHLGVPALGVEGAAVATVLSRAVELLIVLLWTHRQSTRCPYAVGAYRSLRVPGALIRRVAVLGTPLMLNELLWSAGTTVLNQSYSLRGLEVVSAMNISSTVSNLFFCAFFSMGVTVGILVGQLLGAGELERAVDEDRKLIAFSVVLCAAVGLVMALLAPLLPRVYNTTPLVQELAGRLLLVCAAMLPVNAFTNTCYFTLRAGGKTGITFLFDSGFIWLLCIPVAAALIYGTALPILPIYILVQSLDLVKTVLGLILVRRRSWVKNLVGAAS
ncbi:MAG: MATE family efflux transporter [Oscillospiraceae bacterium]|nr:MATE family efflux transporter [Oscillospiraceae bacterium]